MNGSKGIKSLVWAFLFSILLVSVSVFAAAQQKKPAASAPSKPAAAPKPAAKPAAAPKPAAKPAARPATQAHPATTGAKTGGATSAKTGGAAGAKTGGATTAKTGGAAGAKTGGATTAKTGGAAGAKTGGAAGAKTGGAAGAKTGGAVTAKGGGHPPGGTSKVGANGSTHNFNSAGKRTSVETKGGNKANFNRSGHVSTIHTKSGMTINHGAHGERRFESRRAGGGRVVGYGRGRGYAEHGYYRGGHAYMRRSYYYGGRSYAYAYRGYYWHGAAFYGFVPSVYYGAAFYGWAYNPWAAPVAFGWGWGGAPWYGYYGAYFAPAPVYATPALWITDYLIAANLQAAYESRAEANAAANAAAAADTEDAQASGGGGGAVGLTPEVKQQIADEVRAQIQAQQAAAAHPEPAEAASSAPPAGGAQNGPDELPAALDPAHRTFIVSAVLSESTTDGTECSLSPGDVLTRIQDSPDADQNVKVLVASSQKNDCGSGSQVAVAVQDLQDMHNDFQAKISEGLGKLAENQGKNGMPGGPPSGSRTNAAGQAQPDLTVQADLKAQQDEATQAEKDVQDSSASGSGGSGGGGGGND